MNNLYENSSVPDDTDANNQVRRWLGGGIRLGRVRSLHSDGWGYIKAYGDDKVLIDPDGREVNNVWFRNDSLDLDEGDWVVFKPEDSPPEQKTDYENPYLMRAAKGSVKLVRDISELRKYLPTYDSPFMNELRDNYLDCLFIFGQRLFIAEAYAHDLENQIDTKYQKQFSKWQNEEQSRIKEIEKTLEEEQRILAEKRQQIEQNSAEVSKKREEIEQAKLQIERELRELEETRQAIQLYEEQVNESLQRWGFDPISKETDKSGFAEFANERELIDHIFTYIASQGFSFHRTDIVNFYTCLKTGAIVVLAGLSGTGKSSLVRLFANAVGADFALIPVKATWNDDTDLLGFYHPEKKTYISTLFLDTIVEANANLGRLFFICLDEMNLSRVEHYFSDFLSVLEQGEERKLPLYSENEWRIREIELERQRQNFKDGRITEDELNYFERNVRCYRHEVLIPHNVFICGTVNVDETTHSFSDKVLDRVQIIQFETVEFSDEKRKDSSIRPVKLSFDKFHEYCSKTSEIPIDSVRFNELNKSLQAGGFHFGHRVKQQIENYCRYAFGSGLFDNWSADDIVDIQIVQKILPKIRGINTQTLREKLFPKLRGFCAERYPRTLAKIEVMEQMEAINYWEVFRYVG